MNKCPKHPSIFVLLAIMTTLLQGCVSWQVPPTSGRPKLIGFGSARTIPVRAGQIVEIIAPGLSLRMDSTAPGISLGYHVTRLFYPAAVAGRESSRPPVAIQTKCIGLDLAPFHLMIGMDNTFAIPLPSGGSQTIQRIEYSESEPTNTVIEQKEIK
jgi:hypothetical protein